MNRTSIKSICWLYKILYGGVENRAYHMSKFLSQFVDVELIFAKTMFSTDAYSKFFPKTIKNRIHFIAEFLSKFADIEFLFERFTFSKTSSEKSGNLRFRPIRIFFDPYSVYIKRFWEEFFIKKATKYLKNERVGKIIVDGQGINAIPGINLGLPTVTTLHGIDRWIENPPKLEKTLIKKANKIITITKRMKTQLIKKGVENEKISVIYNGVDFQGIRNTKIKSKGFLTKYGVTPEKGIILSVHNFDEKKNTRAIIDSFVTIQKKNDDYQLVLIGDGFERQRHINYVTKRRIEDIYFLGRIFSDDFYRFYKLADIFILPSFKETWPIVYMEAMAAKCAVIITTDSDMAELVEHEKHGIFVDPRSQSDIEKALISLIEDTNLKEHVKTNGHKLASKLSWERQGKLFWNLIQGLMG